MGNKLSGFSINNTGKTGQLSVKEQTVDLQRALLQQLRSLQTSGLSVLPSASGKSSFDGLKALLDGQSAPAVADRVVQAPAATSPAANEVVAAETAAQPAAAQPQAAAIAAPGPAQGTPVSDELALPYPQSLPLNARQTQLKVLNDLVSGCSRCDQLVTNRTQTVFGVGDPAARLVFVGEGPGADEDRLGEPFVGAAGQLLNKILEACKLSRDQVYILNTVKCRPPRNRNPSDVELSNCWGYAREQLEILQPEFICCLGSVAAKTLLGTKQPLGRLRQQFHSYRGSRVIVTYHPAYLLRTPSAKRHVWDDMKLLMQAMGVDL